MGNRRSKEELDQVAVDVEFLLISVVQGVALAALATSAAPIIGGLNAEYFFYVASAFLFILVFWSAAIGHVLSFIDWPLDLIHNFLYLLASLFEVIAFSYLKDPARWFGFVSLFLGIIGALYIWDLKLIKKHKSMLSEKLYADILAEQRYELLVLFPAGLLYSVVATVLTVYYPGLFIAGHYHVALIAIQSVFSLIVLGTSAKAFKRRSRLIEE